MIKLRYLLICVIMCFVVPSQAQSVITIKEAISVLDQSIVRDFEMCASITSALYTNTACAGR